MELPSLNGRMSPLTAESQGGGGTDHTEFMATLGSGALRSATRFLVGRPATRARIV